MARRKKEKKSLCWDSLNGLPLYHSAERKKERKIRKRKEKKRKDEKRKEKKRREKKRKEKKRKEKKRTWYRCQQYGSLSKSTCCTNLAT